MLNSNVTIDANVKILRSGVVTDGYGATSYVYAVFNKEEAEAEVGWVADEGNTEFAERLTGWSYYRTSAGGRFADDPCIKVFGKKLLVTQRCGMDV